LFASAALITAVFSLAPLGQANSGHSGDLLDVAGSANLDVSFPTEFKITAAPACATMVKLRTILFERTSHWELLSMSPGACLPVESSAVPTISETRLVEVNESPSFWTSSTKN
jgi:hypothetical protein